MNKLYTTTEIGKAYGLTARKVNLLLEHSGVIRKVNGNWELCTAYKQRGYVVISIMPFTHSDGTPDESRTMKWTETGKFFVENKIESKGIEKLEGVKS